MLVDLVQGQLRKPGLLASGRRSDRVCGDPGDRKPGGGDQHLAHKLLPWFACLCVNLSKKCGAQATGAVGEGSSRRDCALDVAHGRHEGVRRGDKVCPLSQNLGVERTQVWGYLNGRTPARPGRRRSHVLDRARERSGRKSPPDLFRRALIVPLSARDRSARIIENGSCKPTLKPVARGDILNPIPSRPVRVMATAIVRVHRNSRNRRSALLGTTAATTVAL